MFLSKKIKELNNRAFTLVEVICAVAILAIISVSVVSFITISSNSFKESNKEVNLQYESQQALNQIKDMVMDSNRAVCYYETPGANPGDPELDHTFLVLNEKATGDIAAPYEYPSIKIWYVPSDEKIYYASHTFSYSDLRDKYEDSSHSTVDMKELGGAITTTNAAVLVDHVSAFSVNDALAEAEKKVSVNLGLTIGTSSYNANSSVVMRNKVIASDNVAEIFDGTRRIRNNGRVNDVKILMGAVDVTNLTLDYEHYNINKPTPPAEGTNFSTYTFTALVDAIELGTDVTWTLTGSSVDDGKVPSSISNGVVSISSDEKSTMLTVKAISNADISKTAQITLAIPLYDRTVGYASGISVALQDRTTTQTSETFKLKVTPTFENADKVTNKGYTYTLINSSSGEIYSGSGLSNSADIITLVCDAEDNLKNYLLTVFTIADDPYGNKKSATYSIDVSQLLTPDAVQPTVEINPAETQLCRNENYLVELITSNFNSVSNVRWVFEKKSGFYSLSILRNFDLITVSGTDRNKRTINVDKSLKWDSSFEFTGKAIVEGKDNSGKKVTVESNVVTFSINPVTITISENTDTVTKNEKKYINYTVNNISLGKGDLKKAAILYDHDDYWGVEYSTEVTLGGVNNSQVVFDVGNKLYKDYHEYKVENCYKVGIKLYIESGSSIFTRQEIYSDEKKWTIKKK